MITFCAEGRNATIKVDEPITSGSVGLPVRFWFDAAWTGLQKQVSYRANNATYSRALMGDTDQVPWECLTKPGVDLWIGVVGKREDGTVVMPTAWVRVDRIKMGAVPDGSAPGSPTPSWAEQFQQIAEELQASFADLSSREGTHTHQQTVASNVWTYTHNLGKYPAVTIVDSGGNVVYGEVRYLDMNTVEVTFPSTFSGTMYLN